MTKHRVEVSRDEKSGSYTAELAGTGIVNASRNKSRAVERAVERARDQGIIRDGEEVEIKTPKQR